MMEETLTILVPLMGTRPRWEALRPEPTDDSLSEKWVGLMARDPP